MFETGEFIVYGNSGVCVVDEVTNMKMGQEAEKTYYKLVPVENKSSKIFTPVDNDKVVMRKMLSKSEAQELLDKFPGFQKLCVTEDKLREEKYKEALRTCNPEIWFGMLLTISERYQLRAAEGRKVTSLDERYYKQVLGSLVNELALALQDTKENVTQIIKLKLS